MYTKEEILDLSPEELSELMYFGSPDTSYSYSDIVKFETGNIIMRNGDTLTTESAEHLESYKLKKLRYDMVVTTLKSIDTEATSKAQFRDEVAALVNTQVTNLQNSYEANAGKVIDVVADVTYELKNTIKGLGDEISTVGKKYNAKLKDFDTFNTKSFDIKMDKVDKILDAFKELIKD